MIRPQNHQNISRVRYLTLLPKPSMLIQSGKQGLQINNVVPHVQKDGDRNF